ncbi:hypothetical protein PVA38_11705 [Streptococcus pneumoniae D39]|nr:hypothetical protein PVA38_11705 [Streptococcus pneumoniae D39]
MKLILFKACLLYTSDAADEARSVDLGGRRIYDVDQSLDLSIFFFLLIRRPPRSTLLASSAASDVYKRQVKIKFHLLQDLLQQIKQ